MPSFPKDVSLIIADYAAIWTIAPWVPAIGDLKIFDFGRGNPTLNRLCISYLSKNPNAEDALRGSKYLISELMDNPADWAVDICEPMYSVFHLHEICMNPNPRAIKFISDNLEEVWDYCLMEFLPNPGGIELIKSRWMNTHDKLKSIIYENPSEEIPSIVDPTTNLPELRKIAGNPASWNIDYLKTHQDNDLKNIGSFYSNTHPWAIKKIETFIEQGIPTYNWLRISANPGAIKILQKYPDRICIDILKNPGIFEPTIRPGVTEIIDNLTW